MLGVACKLIFIRKTLLFNLYLRGSETLDLDCKLIFIRDELLSDPTKNKKGGLNVPGFRY